MRGILQQQNSSSHYSSNDVFLKLILREISPIVIARRFNKILALPPNDFTTITACFDIILINRLKNIILFFIRKMVENLDYDVLRYIFKYLNGIDLCSVSQVCRTWWKAADDEIGMRGPICISEEKKDEFPEETWEIIKTRLNESLHVKPSFIIYSTCIGSKSFLSDDCHCHTLPYCCYGISLDNFNSILNEKEMISMIFPNARNVTTSFFTFILRPWRLLFCEELDCLFMASFRNAKQLKTVFEEFFVNDTSMTSCMILLCDHDSSSIAINLIESLNVWFPNSRASVWGGLVDILNICAYTDKLSFCKSPACISSIIISGTTLQTWNIAWDINSTELTQIEKKFEVLKENVKLKKHSIGFMFISLSRGSYCYRIEPLIFKRFFPNVHLITLGGIEAFGGIGFAEVIKNRMINWKIGSIPKTTVMILTYD